MATPSEKLAESLEPLWNLQQNGIVAIKSSMLSRTHRERLQANGFIREVYRGWYMVAPPGEAKGDTTSWYSSYWHFCGQLLKDKYGQNWYISPEQSLLLHAGNWTVPQQLIVKSPDAGNFKTDLLYGMSLFHIKSPLPAMMEIIEKEQIRLLSLPDALILSSPTIFERHPIEMRTALLMVKDASQLLALLLREGQSTVAGRLAGAFRNINEERIANSIITTMQKAGYDIRESDPFETKINTPLAHRDASPYGNRIRLMWHQMRDVVIKHFPAAPGIPPDATSYLQQVEKLYVTDAYHSLSIEKYIVTPELIERVRSGAWSLHEHDADRQQRDAMAARGYWDAFQSVEKSVGRVLTGQNAGKVADADHGEWYRELFGPGVIAGLLSPADLAGYRNHQVYISQSKHVPLSKEAVRDAMPVLFEMLQQEPEASVRAVLGHFIFVFIHPYMDGNGRMGRFLMNVMLASGGYPWTVIPVQQRTAYMQALEKASAHQDIAPFARFLGQLVSKSLKGSPVAAI